MAGASWLGRALDRPNVFVLCWTPDGCERAAERLGSTGGTASAIVLAERHGVPVYNLARPDAEHLLALLMEGPGTTLPGFALLPALQQRQEKLF